MVVKWYVDEGLAVLIAQWKKEFPNAVVYTIGDASHQSRSSEHNPEPQGSAPGADANEVDAADFMIGTGKPGQPTRADLQELRDQLVERRDSRLWYVIWNHKITSSTTQPWVERPYSGSDPHTDHVHTSVNDNFDKNTAPWKIEDEPMKKYAMTTLPKASLPSLRYGDDDAAYEGYNQVHRAQYMLNYVEKSLPDLDPDGIYGPKMKAKVAKALKTDGKQITATQLAGLLGITGY